MRSVFDFIVKPIGGRYNNDIEVGDYKLTLNSSIEDFKFIGIDINEEVIRNTPKIEYKKKRKKLIKIAAFEEMNNLKKGKKKVMDVKYQGLEVQKYLIDPDFSTEKRNLLYALRSRMHASKSNFRKMNSGNLLCSQGCQYEEDQTHIFQNCQILNINKEQVNLGFIRSDRISIH